MFASNKTAAKPAPKNTISSAKSTPDSSQASTQTSTKPAATKTAPLKREGSSLFKAFAKARPKAQDEPSPAVDAKATEDGKEHLECVLIQDLTMTVDPMDGLSDEEADDEDTAMLDDGALAETGGKSKKEREDELRRMMDMEGKNHLIPCIHILRD
jgi:DNA polymerase delta subunit 3